mmetsp:Transcript_3186/g.9228  ORF Transcript_3186/g.9228 Transcript_3186/m.9228 type:complete len:313 (-) Transcript_3186:246-1184(-)
MCRPRSRARSFAKMSTRPGTPVVTRTVATPMMRHSTSVTTLSGVLRDWHLPPPSMRFHGSSKQACSPCSSRRARPEARWRCTRRRYDDRSKRREARSSSTPIMSLKAWSTGSGALGGGSSWGRSKLGRPLTATSVSFSPASSSSLLSLSAPSCVWFGSSSSHSFSERSSSTLARSRAETGTGSLGGSPIITLITVSMESITPLLTLPPPVRVSACLRRWLLRRIHWSLRPAGALRSKDSMLPAEVFSSWRTVALVSGMPVAKRQSLVKEEFFERCALMSSSVSGTVIGPSSPVRSSAPAPLASCTCCAGWMG